jgi:4-alpha-glucanotransferase
MFPFAAFWHGEDTVWRQEAGLLDPDKAIEMRRWREELKGRLVRYLVAAGLLEAGEEREEEVAAACLAWLGGCPAETVLVNLEDLWAETRPQNIPGTGPERENWRGKARYPLEELRASTRVVRALARLDLARRQEREGS